MRLVPATLLVVVVVVVVVAVVVAVLATLVVVVLVVVAVPLTPATLATRRRASLLPGSEILGHPLRLTEQLSILGPTGAAKLSTSRSGLLHLGGPQAMLTGRRASSLRASSISRASFRGCARATRHVRRARCDGV